MQRRIALQAGFQQVPWGKPVPLESVHCDGKMAVNEMLLKTARKTPPATAQINHAAIC
jgi:hypothetical protein